MHTSNMKQTKLKLKDIVRMPNVAAHLSDEELEFYGAQAVEGYKADLQSRAEWAERNSKAIKLALQVVEHKSFPWPGASNVKFPLVTIAALQFLARISILTKGKKLAKAEAWGMDPTGQKTARAGRISEHLNFQLLEQDRNWLDDDEMAKLSASILGCAIKKTYYDGVEGINRSEYVPLMNFVVDYYCRDLNTAQRATQLLEMFSNKVLENERRGLFLKMSDTAPGDSGVSNLLAQTSDDVAGLREQQQGGLRPYEVLEQHCWLDLDGDGYAEPYSLFVRLDTAQTLRIVARYFDVGDVYRKHDAEVKRLEAEARDTQEPAARSKLEREAQKLEDASSNQIVRITPTTFFTKYTFIPSPDGGFYGLGLGALLGPTNAAVDSLINQIIDAGTMLTTSGGFLGRGVKIKSGKQTFDPFEWKPVDGAGDDLRKNIVPLPVNPPNEVLFSLLGLLIQYGEKIGSATDVMSGVNPGQNTPAETSRNTLEQGMMLFSGIYTRMYRSFGEELRKMYNLNRLFLAQSPHFYDLTEGEGALIAADDYETNAYRVYPSADATAVSAAQKQAKAKLVFDVAHASGGFDMYEVNRRLLEANDVDAIEQVYPNPKGPNAIPQGADPKMELEKAKLAFDAQVHQDEMGLAIAELQKEIQLVDAQITEKLSKAALARAEAAGVDNGHRIAMMTLQVGAAKTHKENLMRLVDKLQSQQEANRKHELELKKLGQPDAATTAPIEQPVPTPGDAPNIPAPPVDETGLEGMGA